MVRGLEPLGRYPLEGCDLCYVPQPHAAFRWGDGGAQGYPGAARSRTETPTPPTPKPAVASQIIQHLLPPRVRRAHAGRRSGHRVVRRGGSVG